MSKKELATLHLTLSASQHSHFSPEDGNSMFVRNDGIYIPTSPDGVTTQKINIDIFAAVRTSDFIKLYCLFI
jgi:hypothetical protein